MPDKNILITAISKYVDMLFENIFILISKLPVKNGKLPIFIMSDGAHNFWEKRPKFSEKNNE